MRRALGILGGRCRVGLEVWSCSTARSSQPPMEEQARLSDKNPAKQEKSTRAEEGRRSKSSSRRPK